MFSMKCLSGLNNNMGGGLMQLSQLSQVSQQMQSPSILLHDLRKSKQLSGSNAEIYKCFINYMKDSQIELNLNNLQSLLQSFNIVYNNSASKTTPFQTLYKKELQLIKSEFVTNTMTDFAKNTLLSFGFLLYYVIKSNGFGLLDNKYISRTQIVIIATVVMAVIFGYTYYVAHNKNHVEEILHRFDMFTEEMTTEMSKFEFDQILLSTHNSNTYSQLINKMLNDMKQSVHTTTTTTTTSINVTTFTTDNNQDNNILIQNADDGDEEEMFEIIMSPEEPENLEAEPLEPLEPLEPIQSEEIKAEQVEQVVEPVVEPEVEPEVEPVVEQAEQVVKPAIEQVEPAELTVEPVEPKEIKKRGRKATNNKTVNKPVNKKLPVKNKTGKKLKN